MRAGSHLGTCVTTMQTVSFSFCWKVTDFLLLPQKSREYLDSSHFAAPGVEGKWYLRLYPVGDGREGHADGDAEPWVSVYILYSGSCRVHAVYSVKLCTDFEGRHVLEERSSDPSPFCQGRFYGYPWFIRTDDVVAAVKQTRPALPLYIVCAVQVLGPLVTQPLSPPAAGPEAVVPLGQALYEDASAADVVLHVRGQEIPAHRSVLMARSPAFRAMLTHDMAEKATGRIDVPDYSAAAVREMKRFMYTGAVDNLRDVGAEVLDLAVAYELHELKALCVSALPHVLCRGNVCRIFAMARAHALQDLSDSAIQFLCSRGDVLESVLSEGV